MREFYVSKEQLASLYNRVYGPKIVTIEEETEEFNAGLENELELSDNNRWFQCQSWQQNGPKRGRYCRKVWSWRTEFERGENGGFCTTE